jgi:outer membrane protein insertion porin family
VDKKSDRSKIIDEANIEIGKVLDPQYKQQIRNAIVDYYQEKGYNNPEIDIRTANDTSEANGAKLLVSVDRGEKTKIQDIYFNGNTVFSDRELETSMKKTRDRNILNLFKSSKFRPNQFPEDKRRILQKYRSNGYRDVEITSDSMWYVEPDRLAIQINIEEGDRYYFRDISWSGNTKYTSDFLASVLNIQRGDVYNPERLQQKIYANPKGPDISSLYLDNGYLFFSVEPVETRVSEDSVDLEIRIREGQQAKIDEVTISGNTKTSDHVVLRELRTRPGEIFNRSDIIRSQRELSQLGFFDPEQMNVVPTPDPEEGTVDLEYQVTEKETDQIELSGGWGNGQLVGVLGLSFNNFAAGKIFEKNAWRPLPSGDGQKLSLRAQRSQFFSSYNISFTEPWFGGRKPNSLSVSAFHSRQTQGGNSRIYITGTTVGLGKRLKWPDDFFTLFNSVSYRLYDIENFNSDAFPIATGDFNSVSFEHRLSRNSVSQPIYPRSGSNFSLSFTWTPPHSLWSEVESEENGNGDAQAASGAANWLEYHKWKFNADWYLNPAGKFVITPQIEYGFLGRYNQGRNLTQFERFFVGGDGLSGFNLDGRELIRLRGYGNNTLTPRLLDQNGNRLENGGAIYQKYTLEMRYPVSLNPSATVYILGFLEGGNNFIRFRDFDPFSNYRSIGVGARVFLPMFGKLGLDYGYGLDPVGSLPGAIPQLTGAHQGQFHFSIGQQF